jgi:uncharacterized protein YcnI
MNRMDLPAGFTTQKVAPIGNGCFIETIKKDTTNTYINKIQVSNNSGKFLIPVSYDYLNKLGDGDYNFFSVPNLITYIQQTVMLEEYKFSDDASYNATQGDFANSIEGI